MENSAPSALSKFIVPVTIMLSFVSFWRAAAIVLCDLGSSAYYVGGIAEKAIGKAAPWFIFAIMLFSYAVRAVYIESCSMFVRGGVYRVVREAMGSTAAKFSVSALIFDYVLTGPISAVSAGLYLAGLINESGKYFSASWMHVPTPLFALAFAILVTLYFWHTNRIGIPFSSTRALRIMQITTVMVVILITWCLITIFTQGYQPVPPPTLANLKFSDESLGWLKGTIVPSITIVAILIGLGHSLLGMSGEESLAQVNREIAAPKHQNLVRTGFVIFVYSLVFTSLVSFFAVMIIPDAERSHYFDNLISGISIFLVGPDGLKLVFHAFVVLVGTLILSGAVNTAIIGSNGVLNRVAEDGVLPEWFREPHNKHGTTYRIINLIVILQLLTIVASRGNVYMLGEAYAFGVVWSFAMKALAVVVLRFTEPDVQRWRVPLNFRIRGIEVPLGLIFITVTLFLLAGINALTKKTATISGITFTLVFFAAFTIFERRRQAEKRKGSQGRARRVIEEGEMERFRLEVRENLSPTSLQVRPGNILVPVHDPDSLSHLQKVLDEFDPEKLDVIVFSVNVDAAEKSRDLAMLAEQVVDNYETVVFSRVVHLAEKVGKPVSLVAVAGSEPYQLILQAAGKLRSSRIVVGLSSVVSASKQEQEVYLAWEQSPEPRPTVTLQIVRANYQAPIEIRLGTPVSRPSEETRN
jgi:amino acid transporter